MKILRDRKLPFGVSCCYTSRNTEVIGSEEFFDDMIAKGAKFAWFFTYMPVGVSAAPELLASPEQREYMYRQVRAFRRTKPIFTMDFWNDGEYSGGCVRIIARTADAIHYPTTTSTGSLAGGAQVLCS